MAASALTSKPGRRWKLLRTHVSRPYFSKPFSQDRVWSPHSLWNPRQLGNARQRRKHLVEIWPWAKARAAGRRSKYTCNLVCNVTQAASKDPPLVSSRPSSPPVRSCSLSAPSPQPQPARLSLSVQVTLQACDGLRGRSGRGHATEVLPPWPANGDGTLKS